MVITVAWSIKACLNWRIIKLVNILIQSECIEK